MGRLAATLAIAGCAASASSATSSFSTPFAACFLIGRIIPLLLLARAWRHAPEARPTITIYLASTGISAALWAVSIGTTGTARLLLWVAAVVIDAAGPVLATRREALLLVGGLAVVTTCRSVLGTIGRRRSTSSS